MTIIEQKLREKCEGILRTWGGKLEHLYEYYWAKHNIYFAKAMGLDSDSLEFKEAEEKSAYYHALIMVLVNYKPDLIVWGRVNSSLEN